jgi:serine/threonine protein kinase
MAEQQFEPGQMGARRFGDYVIHGLLGEGGMARVYAAEELLSHRPVALKLLRAEFGASEHGRQQFLTEMGILANLDDPRIVRCLTCTQIEGQLVMVLEKLEGRTLRETLKVRGPLPWPEVADIVYQIARALVTAHSHYPPIVHRDLKPENVMCLVDGRIKVMDFGIAKMLETIAGTTTHSGTPDYMSPEQIDALPIDGRSDLFALGVMAWEMLAGRRPFVSDSPRAQLEQVCTAPTPALPEQVRAGLPPVLEQLIGWLLAKQPVDRPRSAEQVVSLLEPLVRSSPGPRPTWTPPTPIATPIAPPSTPPFRPSAPALEPSLNTMAIVEAIRPRQARVNKGSGSLRMIALGSAALAAIIVLAVGARWVIGTSDDEDDVVQPESSAVATAEVTAWLEPVESLALDFGASARPPLRSRYVVQLSSHRYVDEARDLLERARLAGFEGALIQKTPVICVVLEGGATKQDAEAVAVEASSLTQGKKLLTQDFELWCDAPRARGDTYVCRPYVLWARTHEDPGAAIKTAAKVEAAGIPVRVVKHDGMFKVLVGLYENSDAAAADERRILGIVGGESASVWRPMRECRAVRPARGYDICEG